MDLLAALRSRLFGTPVAEPSATGSDVTEEATRPVCADMAAIAEVADECAAPPDHEQVTPDTPRTEEAPDPAVAARQERAAGWLLDDEGLRGDLTDDEYQPLLDWALTATDRIAADTAGLDDDAAETTLDAGVGAVKRLVRAAGAAVAAHVEGGPDRRNRSLGELVERSGSPAVADGDAARAALAAVLSDVEDDPELPGADLAARIAAALAAEATTAEATTAEATTAEDPDARPLADQSAADEAGS